MWFHWHGMHDDFPPLWSESYYGVQLQYTCLELARYEWQAFLLRQWTIIHHKYRIASPVPSTQLPQTGERGKGSQPEQETESISFKGTASEDASWLENADNVQIFPFAGFVQLLYQYVCDRRTILIRIWSSRSTPILVRSLATKSRRLARQLTLRPTWRPCSWRHRHTLPDTNWKRSRPCFHDFQTPDVVFFKHTRA